MTLRTLAFMIVALIAFAQPCAGGAIQNVQQGNPQAQHVWRTSGESVAVPFEWHDGHLVIAVRVNDSAPLRLAFDTGASATVLFETERTRGLRCKPSSRFRSAARRASISATACCVTST